MSGCEPDRTVARFHTVACVFALRMGRCCLSHQIDALNILHELRAHRTNRNSDAGEGHSSVRRCESRRLKTIAERARDGCFTRLLDILSRLISVEEDFIKDASQHERSLVRRKDSVDLKNICLRMALCEGPSSDRDLRELRDCLRLIVSNLLSYVRDEKSLLSTVTRHKLREISNSFPDI